MAEKVANVYLFEVDMDVYLNLSSFCPSSGGLVFLDYNQGVHIVDFLTPDCGIFDPFYISRNNSYTVGTICSSLEHGNYLFLNVIKPRYIPLVTPFFARKKDIHGRAIHDLCHKTTTPIIYVIDIVLLALSTFSLTTYHDVSRKNIKYIRSIQPTNPLNKRP